MNISLRHNVATRWGALVLATCCFAAALIARERISVWIATAVAALISLGACWIADSNVWRRPLLSINAVRFIRALLVGIVLASATHLAFKLLSAHFPIFHSEAVRLYAPLQAFPGPYAALPILLIVVVAEEIIWRGLAYDLTGALLSLILYVLPQLASGSWMPPLLALGCGAVWLAQRIITRNLFEPMLTHFVWSATVLVFFPVTGS